MEMNKKKTVKFLTVIWGDRYIEEFAQVSLPSYLAPENLPYMAEHTDLGVLIMTSKDSVAKLKENAVFKQLEAVCPVEFILIDDLITNGVYGVVLTLAYARGIRSCGEDQVNTHFVFMNSDFVVANGSLKTLTKEIEDGKSVVMASSLRASAEAVMPALLDAVDQEKMQLSMEPREMVRLALADLHPTVVAKTINQDFVSSSTHNQIYWAIDKQTLLGRCHLIFMLMIKPERPLPPINSYCDYGLVPELAPSAVMSAIEDSDRFFMLEAQPAKQELEFLRCGVRSPSEIARELSGWSTEEHRACADFNFVFHSDEVPEETAVVERQADAYIKDLRARMYGRTKDHAFHYYWVSGVEAWTYLRREGDVYNEDAVDAEAYPAEFYPSPAYEAYLSAKENHVEADHSGNKTIWSFQTLKSKLARLRDLGAIMLTRRFAYELLVRVGNGWIRFGRRLKGEYPAVAAWNSVWPDAKLIRDWIYQKKTDMHDRTLVVAEARSPLLEFLRKEELVDCVNEEDMSKKSERQFEKKYPYVLVQVNRKDIRRTKRMLEYALSAANPDGQIAISIGHPNYETDAANFTYELAQYVDDILPDAWLDFDVAAKFTGGRWRRELRKLENGLVRQTIPSSIWGVPVAIILIPLLPIVAAMTALNNLRLRTPSKVCPEYCSSALLILRRRKAR